MTLPNDSPRIVLASASPRRQQLLASMGLSFEVAVSHVDEALHQDSPPALARHLSLSKARAVADIYPRSLIVAADTLVVVDNRILGKPANEKMAFEMLVRPRNRRHMVYSGLSLLDMRQDRHCAQVVMTPVYMRDYADDEIRRYVASGDPMDKAGSYAIQDSDFAPVARIEGCYANVMGLPMCHLYRALRAWKVEIPVHPLNSCPLAVEKGHCLWCRDILEEPIGRPTPVKTG